jgi:hypothetical protein
MELDEVLQRARELRLFREALLEALVAPARAAAHTLKDMKMERTADPLLEALFALDALDQELKAFLTEHSEVILLFALARMGQPPK